MDRRHARWSIKSWNYPGSFPLINRIFRKDLRQDDLLVPHSPNLARDLHNDEEHRPDRQKLHDTADCRDFLGKVERVAYKAVSARGGDLSRLSHNAERAAKLDEHNSRDRVSDKHEKGRQTAHGGCQFAAWKKDD